MSASNNTETHSSTSDSTSSRKGRAECATCASGIATSDLTLISSKPVPTLDTFMNNKKEERKSHFKKKEQED